MKDVARGILCAVLLRLGVLVDEIGVEEVVVAGGVVVARGELAKFVLTRDDVIIVLAMRHLSLHLLAVQFLPALYFLPVHLLAVEFLLLLFLLHLLLLQFLKFLILGIIIVLKEIWMLIKRIIQQQTRGGRAIEDAVRRRVVPVMRSHVEVRRRRVGYDERVVRGGVRRRAHRGGGRGVRVGVVVVVWVVGGVVEERVVEGLLEGGVLAVELILHSVVLRNVL